MAGPQSNLRQMAAFTASLMEMFGFIWVPRWGPGLHLETAVIVIAVERTYQIPGSFLPLQHPALQRLP